MTEFSVRVSLGLGLDCVFEKGVLQQDSNPGKTCHNVMVRVRAGVGDYFLTSLGLGLEQLGLGLGSRQGSRDL